MKSALSSWNHASPLKSYIGYYNKSRDNKYAGLPPSRSLKPLVYCNTFGKAKRNIEAQMSNRGALIDSTQTGLFEPPTIAKLLSVGDAISERWCHLQLRTKLLKV